MLLNVNGNHNYISVHCAKKLSLSFCMYAHTFYLVGHTTKLRAE